MDLESNYEIASTAYFITIVALQECSEVPDAEIMEVANVGETVGLYGEKHYFGSESIKELDIE